MLKCCTSDNKLRDNNISEALTSSFEDIHDNIAEFRAHTITRDESGFDTPLRQHLRGLTTVHSLQFYLNEI